MQDVYQRVADRFKDRILEVWQNEESMKVEWNRKFEKIPFSRTDHWQVILYHLFRDCWREKGPEVVVEPTGYDRLAVLKLLHPLLDYNIFSQVLLNLQTYNGMAYQTADATKEVERLQVTWKDKVSSLIEPNETLLDPFTGKPTMVKLPKTAQEREYNLTLSAIRSLRIISTFTPMISFRVSPMGSTPAFADSNNLSMLGMGADKYLHVMPQLEVYYLVWQPGTSPLMARQDIGPGFPNVGGEKQRNGTWFWAEGIDYPFISKSGGEVLQDVLFARKLIYEVFGGVDVTKSILTMLPRMSSVLFVMDKQNVLVQNLLEGLQTRYPVLEVMEGSRVHANSSSNAESARGLDTIST